MKKQLLTQLRWKRGQLWRSLCWKPPCSTSQGKPKHCLRHGITDAVLDISGILTLLTACYLFYNISQSSTSTAAASLFKHNIICVLCRPTQQSNQDPSPEIPTRKISLLSRPFGLGWRDKNKVSNYSLLCVELILFQNFQFFLPFLFLYQITIV